MERITPAERMKQILGDANKIDRELQQFRMSAESLSSSQPRMIEQYPKQWVVLYKGEVRASASTFDAALATATELGLPRENIIVRFIDKNQRTMIL